MSGPTQSAAIFNPAAQNRMLALCLLASVALHLCALLLPGLHPPTLVTLPVLTAWLEPVPALAPRQHATEGLSGSAASPPKPALLSESKARAASGVQAESTPVQSKPKAPTAKPAPLPLKPAPSPAQPPSDAAKPATLIAKRAPPVQKSAPPAVPSPRRVLKSEVPIAKRVAPAKKSVPPPARALSRKVEPKEPVVKRVAPVKKSVPPAVRAPSREVKPKTSVAMRVPLVPKAMPIRPAPKPRAPKAIARVPTAAGRRESAEATPAAPPVVAKSRPEATASAAPVLEPPTPKGTAGNGTSAERSGTGAAAASPEDHIDEAARNRYRLAVIASARHYKRYPATAVDNGWQGKVVVHLVIGANGRMQSTAIQSSSGYEILDRQALDMVRKAKPLTPIPPELRGRTFSVDIPVIFNLQAG